ncbi:MAG: patatin-like phospholipase family protein [Byssovorax sp.]
MRPNSVALILTGAVTRGAFEAGVLKVLADRGVAVRQILAASSGALNGTAYAAGVRARREAVLADRLVELWLDSGDLCSILNIRPGALLRGRGVSDQKKLLALLRRHVTPCRIPCPQPIGLHIIVAPLRGVEAAIGPWPATTYVSAGSFQNEDFDTSSGLEEVFRAATASSAFPGLFTPVDVPGLGPCVDGGFVDGTPLREIRSFAIGTTVDTLLIVAPTPIQAGGYQRNYVGLGILGHVIDMLFTERAHQDMRDVHDTNMALLGLEDLARQRGWGAAEISDIKVAMGLQDRRVLELVTIRPLEPLPGGIFSGLTSSEIRRRYVQLGMERATEVLDSLGW